MTFDDSNYTHSDLQSSNDLGGSNFENVTIDTDNSTLTITNLEITDHDVIQHFVQLTELGQSLDDEVNRALRVGVIALANAGMVDPTVRLRHQVDQASKEISGQIVTATRNLTEEIDRQFAENAPLALRLRERVAEFSTRLNQELTAENGILKPMFRVEMNAMTTAIAQEIETHKSFLKELVNPANPDSALNGMSTKIADLETKILELHKALEISEAVSGFTGKIEDIEQSMSASGLRFEDIVLQALEQAVSANHYKDSIHDVSKVAGADLTNKGDILARIDSAAIQGESISVVWECKSVKKMTKQEAKTEIDLARRNRGTKTGVLIFDGFEFSDKKFPLGMKSEVEHIDDDFFAVIYNPKEPNETLLRFAYAWSRWAAIKDTSNSIDTIDEQVVNKQLERVRSALDLVKTIKSDHTQAGNAIRLAHLHVAELKSRLEAELDELESVIFSGSDQQDLNKSLQSLDESNTDISDVPASLDEYAKANAESFSQWPSDKESAIFDSLRTVASYFPGFEHSAPEDWHKGLTPSVRASLLENLGADVFEPENFAKVEIGQITAISGIGEAALSNLGAILAQVSNS